MKIAITDTTLSGPLIGGAQTFLPGLMSGLKKQGHEVYLITKGTPDKRIEKLIVQSGAIIYTNLWNKNELVEDSARVFARWINKLEPDIYLISVSADIAWLTLPYLKSSIKTFAIAHSNSHGFYLPAGHYKNFLTGAVGVSHEICGKYHSISGISKDRIEWIPYGIDPSPGSPVFIDRDELNIVFVGRMEEIDKRISDVAAIAKRLAKQNLNYYFTIVGDGSQLANLQTQLATEIENKKVILTGWLKSDAIKTILQQSDIFILTSSSEGFPISLLEAMANGCCPVVTNIPSGIIQMIENEKNGYLIEVGDIDSFVNKLIYLFQNREKLIQMRVAAWETGKNFTVEIMVRSYEKYFMRLENQAERKPDPYFPILPSCRSKYPRWLRKLKVLSKKAGLMKTD